MAQAPIRCRSHVSGVLVPLKPSGGASDQLIMTEAAHKTSVRAVSSTPTLTRMDFLVILYGIRFA